LTRLRCDTGAGYSGGVFDGSGGLVGSTADYMKFAIMLCNKGLGANGARILGPRSVEHMSMNHLPGNVDIAAMGVQSVRPTNHIAASLVLPS
jgi:CubicO group peptidase (beta-lactamase class C family)